MRGPKAHSNIKFLHSGSKAQDNRNSRNRGCWDPYVDAVLWALDTGTPRPRMLKLARPLELRLLGSCSYDAVPWAPSA